MNLDTFHPFVNHQCKTSRQSNRWPNKKLDPPLGKLVCLSPPSPPQAPHKVILASSSPSNENLWKRNKDPHPLIYMREIADDQKITEMLAHQRGRSSF